MLDSTILRAGYSIGVNKPAYIPVSAVYVKTRLRACGGHVKRKPLLYNGISYFRFSNLVCLPGDRRGGASITEILTLFLSYKEKLTIPIYTCYTVCYGVYKVSISVVLVKVRNSVCSGNRKKLF